MLSRIERHIIALCLLSRFARLVVLLLLTFIITFIVVAILLYIYYISRATSAASLSTPHILLSLLTRRRRYYSNTSGLFGYRVSGPRGGVSECSNPYIILSFIFPLSFPMFHTPMLSFPYIPIILFIVLLMRKR